MRNTSSVRVPEEREEEKERNMPGNDSRKLTYRQILCRLQVTAIKTPY